MDRHVRAISRRLRLRARRLSLGVKLDLMLLVPLLALAVFAAGAVQDKLSDRGAAHENLERTNLAAATGSFIRELQRERGLSGIAVNSGSESAEALVAQWALTDEARVGLGIAIEDSHATVDQRFTDAQPALEASWEWLMQQRLGVAGGELESASAMRPYTGMIEQLLDIVTYANVLQSDGAKLSSLTVAHWDFLHSEERSALIRGILGASASVGVLSDEDRIGIHGLVAEERSYLHLFLDRAPREMVDAYWAVLAEAEVQTALLLRAELLSGELVSSSPDSGLVFESLSIHVDGLFTLERRIIGEIRAEAFARESRAGWALAIIGTGAIALLVLSFIVLWVVARSISRPLVALAAGARKIAEGDLEAERSEWTNDPIGEIGMAFEDMRAYLAEMAAAAEELAWGNLESEVEPRSAVDTFGNSLAAMTRRLSLTMAESEDRAGQLERTVERLRKSEEQLRHSASHDALTGLPNRVHFMEQLNLELDRARQSDTVVAVAFMDLDKFKVINDTLGHDAGDRLLQLVAQRLRSRIRPGDTVARLGGDEFALVLTDQSTELAFDGLLQRVVDALSRAYEVNGKTLNCSPSMGIALYPADGHEADQLLAKADHAMYEAKRRGGGSYCFYTDDGSVADIAM